MRAMARVMVAFVLLTAVACRIVEPGKTTVTPTSVAGASAPGQTPVTPVPVANAPAPPTIEAVGWYGWVTRFRCCEEVADVLTPQGWFPKGVGAIRLVGATQALTDQIEELSKNGHEAHYWGALTCETADYGVCALRVTRVHVQGSAPAAPSQDFEDWVGTIVSAAERLPDGDYLVLDSPFPAHYAVSATNATVEAQLRRFRDTSTRVRVQGRVDFEGVPQIEITDLRAL